jgi:hypothetical protein
MSSSMMKARIGELEDPRERRRSTRFPTDIDARMRELGETGIEARILNISEHGFMAESQSVFDIGTRVWLMLPGRERANAVVKWMAGDRFGAQFAEPISLEGLDAQ